MCRRRSAATILALMSLLLCASESSSRASNLLLNPSFEEPLLSLGTTRDFSIGQTIGEAWFVSNAVGGRHGNPVLTREYEQDVGFWPSPTDGLQYLYVSDHAQSATIYQDVDLAGSTRYLLTFDLANFLRNFDGNGAQLDIDILRVGSSILGGPITFTRPMASGFEPQQLEFTSAATGIYRLQLKSRLGYGTNLDNLSLAPVSLLGDTDLDGDVDLDDLNNVRNHFDEFGSPVIGDTNADGIVDLTDLNNVRNHFGENIESQPVPEPSAIALAVAALSFLVSVRQCRRAAHLAFLTMLTLFSTQFVRADFPDEIKWVGNQGGCVNLSGAASWFDGIYWLNYWHPGETYDPVTAEEVGQNPTNPTDDIAIFDPSFHSENSPDFTNYVYFGDYQTSYSLPCTSSSLIPGGMAEAGEVVVQKGHWTFDFGSNVGANNGGLNVAGVTTVGTVQPISPFDNTTLTVKGPGELVTDSLFIAQWAGTSATVEVMGSDTHLNQDGDVFYVHVGVFGQGRLSVREGASLFGLGGNIGSFGTQAQGVIEVQGAGSEVTLENAVSVGFDGHGEILVTEGGAFTGGHVVLGERDPASSGVLKVAGAGTSFATTYGNLEVGRVGTGEATLSSGAVADIANSTFVGLRPGSSGELTVRDDGSVWRTAGSLVIAAEPESHGALTVKNGGRLSVDGLAILGGAGAAEILLTDPGSVIELPGQVWFGNGAESESVMRVQNGAQLITHNFVGIGTHAPGPGTHKVILTGEDTLWDSRGASSQGNVTVGHDRHGQLSIERGATALARWVQIGFSSTGRGELLISDPETRVETELLMVGALGQASVGISDGAHVESDFGDVGNGPGSSGEVAIAGANSVWNIAVDLTVGRQGEGNVVLSDQGALHIARLLFLGYEANTSSGEITLTSGANLTVGEQLYVGVNGSGSLDIQDATVVVGQSVPIGRYQGSNGAVRIGSGGVLESAAQIRVGREGVGLLLIEQGGRVQSGHLFSPTNTSAFIGEDATGVALATVKDEGSVWELDGYLVVGRFGHGTLSVEEQGRVNSADGRIGMSAGAVGVAELRSLGAWHVSNNLYVGGSEIGPGGAGLLKTSDDGRVQIGRELRVYNDGTIDVSGGRINVGNGALPELGTLRVGQNGTLSGAGEILGDVLIDGGLLSPGASPGILSITGRLTQMSGLLELEIGGPTPGVNYDQRSVGGDVSLAGIVHLIFTDGYVPAPGQGFDVFAPGASFDAHAALLDFDGLPTDLVHSAVLINGRLSFLDAPLFGDTDRDGDVDLSDLNSVRNHFCESGNPVLGDTNADGTVDLTDLNYVRNHFGETRVPQAVPEPHGVTITLIALLTASMCTPGARRAFLSFFRSRFQFKKRGPSCFGVAIR